MNHVAPAGTYREKAGPPATYKTAIAGGNVLFIAISGVAAALSHWACDRDSFAKVAVIALEISNNEMDLRQVFLAFIILGGVLILTSVFGCWRVLLTDATFPGGALAYACLLWILGVVFGALSLAVLTFVRSSTPEIIKTSNRVCRNFWKTAIELKCPQSTINHLAAAIAGAPPANTGRKFPTDLFDKPKANQPSSRLLSSSYSHMTRRLAAVVLTVAGDRFVPSVGSLGSTELAWALAQSSVENRAATASASGAAALDDRKPLSISENLAGEGQVASNVSLLSLRRLDPGSTEYHWLDKVCGRLEVELGSSACVSKCDLLQQLCDPPPEFDETVACVCDPDGPRVYQKITANPTGAMLNEAINGQSEKELVSKDCPESMIEEGTCSGQSCSVSLARQMQGFEDEGCWVLPTTRCKGEIGKPYPTTTDAYYHTGPCSDPDARSRIVVEYVGAASAVYITVGILALAIVCTAFCASCLFCEVHTGKAAAEHVNSVLYGESDDEASSMNMHFDGRAGYIQQSQHLVPTQIHPVMHHAATM